MGHRNVFDQTPEEVPESLLGQTDKILAEDINRVTITTEGGHVVTLGPDLPTVSELIESEKDPEILADLIIIREGLGNDIAEFKVRDHRRAQHPNLKEQ